MLKKITENVEIHQTLPDTPNLTSEELKKEWDKGNKIIKEKFNELIDLLNDAEVLKLKEKIEGTILYDNSTGENEIITLSDSVANYRELRFDYKMSANNYVSKDSIRIFIADGDCFSLSSVVTHSDVLQLIASARYLVSGDTITKQHEIRSRINTSGDVTSDGNMATILITQVIGYRY